MSLATVTDYVPPPVTDTITVLETTNSLPVPASGGGLADTAGGALATTGSALNLPLTIGGALLVLALGVLLVVLGARTLHSRH